jgi:hypothetical protein
MVLSRQGSVLYGSCFFLCVVDVFHRVLEFAFDIIYKLERSINR